MKFKDFFKNYAEDDHDDNIESAKTVKNENLSNTETSITFSDDDMCEQKNNEIIIDAVNDDKKDEPKKTVDQSLSRAQLRVLQRLGKIPKIKL